MVSDTTLIIDSSYLVKWALPNEGMPLYITWSNYSDIDYIKIEKPDDLCIREYYNINKTRENECIIYKDELRSMGYIGIVFSHPMIDVISRDILVVIKFIRSEVELSSITFKSKIIRPLINIEVPEKFEIIKDQPNEMDIKLTYEGYGSVSGRIIFSKDNRDISFDIKKISDLSFMMINYKLFKVLPEEFLIFESEINKEDIPDDQYLFREYLKELFDMNDITYYDIQSTLLKIVEDDKLRKILEEKMESNLDYTNSFFKAILNFIENRPVEDVFLLDPGENEIDIFKDENKMFIKICYIDNFGNLYESSESVNIVIKEDNSLILEKEWDNNPGDWKWLKENLT